MRGLTVYLHRRLSVERNAQRRSAKERQMARNAPMMAALRKQEQRCSARKTQSCTTKADIEQPIVRRRVRTDGKTTAVRRPQLHCHEMNVLMAHCGHAAANRLRFYRNMEYVAVMEQLIDPFLKEQASALVPRPDATFLRAQRNSRIQAETQCLKEKLTIARAYVEWSKTSIRKRLPSRGHIAKGHADRPRKVVAVTARKHAEKRPVSTRQAHETLQELMEQTVAAACDKRIVARRCQRKLYRMPARCSLDHVERPRKPWSSRLPAQPCCRLGALAVAGGRVRHEQDT